MINQHPYHANPPQPTPKELKEITIPRNRNANWENWGFKGCCTGVLLTLFGTLISICEIVRIIYGVTNRGINNYDGTGNAAFNVYDPSLLFRVGTVGGTFGSTPDAFPNRVEKFHYWPWSYASNLFGLVIIGAGMAGIVSNYRRSYTTIFLFMALSLTSMLLAGFLIGYFAVLVNWYVSVGVTGANRPESVNTSFGLIGSNLAFSIVILILGFFGFIFGCGGIRGCEPKGLHLEE